MAQNRLLRPFLSGWASQAAPGGQRRAISNAAGLVTGKAPLPVFAPTSSTELDGLLKKFRDTLFIPMWLSQEDRKIIYQKSKAQQLLEHPIKINVGNDDAEELYTIKPMDFADRPTAQDLKRVVDLMKTKEDWQNLIPLLVGLHTSKRPLSKTTTEIILRKAGLQGAGDVVLRAATSVRRTGISLSSTEIARNLLLALRSKALTANFKGPEVETALRQVMEAVRLLDAPEHKSLDRKCVPQRQPSIIGILLELSAAKSLDSSEGSDLDGEVQSYAEKVLGTWSLETFKVPSKRPAANWDLLRLIPLWHGISLALQVKEIKGNERLYQLLLDRQAQIADVIEGCVKLLEEDEKFLSSAGLKLSKEWFHR